MSDVDAGREGRHPGRHLGFIIEDSPTVPAVASTGQHVDLYGFVSMLLATSQAQSRRIERLERQLARRNVTRSCPSNDGGRAAQR